MKNKLRKIYQHGINGLVKNLNEAIEEDPLWNGRFVFHIMDSQFERFEDGSGGLLYVTIRGYDKKTKVYKDYSMQYAPYLKKHSNYDLWRISCKFITEDTDTWKNDNNPYDDERIDYTKIKIDNNLWSFKYYPFKIF